MSGGQDLEFEELDPRLERTVRDVLDAREPGPAPLALRGRVDRVPEETPARRRGRVAGGLAPYLGVAAAMAVLIGGLVAVGARGIGAVGSGADVTGAVFNPYATGLGVVEAPNQVAIVLMILVLSLLAFYGAGLLGGRKGGVLAVLFLVIPGFFLATQVLAPPRQDSGGINSDAGLTDGTELGFTYGAQPGAIVTAKPGEPYSMQFSVQNRGPLPITIEGFVPTAVPGVADLPSLWLSTTEESASTAPNARFEPVTLLPGQRADLWLVQRASRCSLGDSYRAGAAIGSFVEQPSVQLRWSVAGVPRLDPIPLPWSITTLMRENCVG